MTPADTIYYLTFDFEEKKTACSVDSIGPSYVTDLQAQQLSLA